jgi:hypothetical protein
MAKAPSVPWTREHRLIALNLYYKLPFGKLHRGNPLIKEVAAKMGRTASSLAIKLCNFASLDPVLHARGVVGMTGAANADRALWEEFHSSLSALGVESEQLLHGNRCSTHTMYVAASVASTCRNYSLRVISNRGASFQTSA